MKFKLLNFTDVVYFFRQFTGNSMSNHPIFLDVDTLTSQILLFFHYL